MRRAFVFALGLVAALLWPARARATADFPQKIVQDLAITCPNPIFDGDGCTICHTSNNGGLGTATKPFGVWMKQNGLTPFNEGELKDLLAQLESESPHTTDTNCDGTPDVDQLTSCQWLALASNDDCQADAGSSDGGQTPVSPSVYYGCAVSPATTDSPALPASVALGVAGVLGAALLRARRRRRR